MPPKKQKEKLSLEDFTKMAEVAGSGRSWADDEAEFSTPAFQTISQHAAAAPGSSFGSWTSGGGAGGSTSFGGAASARGSFGPAPVAPIPDQPPFTARIGNVSYDVNESHLHDFFGNEHNLKIETLRLPRGPDGQVRGAAYIDFADRDSLVAALKLGGSQILGRTVSVSVAEQRGPASAGGFGPRGGAPEFDWSKKVDTNEFFSGGPPGGDNDRFSRFRPRSQRPDEPEMDWSSRGAPPVGGPRGPPRQPEPELDWSARTGPISGGPRGSRSAPAPEPELDWSARTGPIAARSGPRAPRQPEPELDWSARTGPIAARSGPRAPRQPEPELDWSARTGPIAARSGPRSSSSASRKQEPEFDWSQRAPLAGRNAQRQGSRSSPTTTTTTASSSTGAGTGRPAAATGTPSGSSSSSLSSTSEPKRNSQSSKIAKLQQGFKALQLDDDETEEKAPTEKKPAAPEASSISEIQQAQRDVNSGTWKEA